MPTENAQFISQLTPGAPTGAGKVREFDDQLRMLKLVLQTQFPNLGAVAIANSATQINKYINELATLVQWGTDDGTPGVEDLGRTDQIKANLIARLAAQLQGIATADETIKGIVTGKSVSVKNLRDNYFPSFAGALGAKAALLNNQADAALTFSNSQNIASGIYRCSSLTVNSGVTLSVTEATQGFLIFLVDGKTTIAGQINMKGKGAAGGSGYTATVGHAGTDGQMGSGGGGGSGTQNGYAGGVGGSGMAAGGTAGQYANGGAGSTADALTVLKKFFSSQPNYDWIGGGGGQGGVYETSNGYPPAGGNGGGAVIIITREFEFTGSIDCSGADGSPTVAPYWNDGPGGGGGGGLALVATEYFTMDTATPPAPINSGTLTAAGGLAGTGAGHWQAGAGSPGYAKIIYPGVHI